MVRWILSDIARTRDTRRIDNTAFHRRWDDGRREPAAGVAAA